MAYRNLDEFLTRLEQAGDVEHFAVDSSHPTVPDVIARDDSKVLVPNYPNGIRVVHNLFGTPRRIEQALRVTSLNLISERLEQLLEIGKPGAVGAMVSRAMTMFSAMRTTTNRRAPNEFQRRTFEDWRDSLGMAVKSLQSHSTEATILTGGVTPRMSSVSIRLTENEIIGEFWPDMGVGETVALVIGGDPAFMVAAYAPLPDFIHRSYFASWLRDKPLDMMHLPGLDIEIPSNAETVIAATVKEQASEFTVLEFTSGWTKANAIYPQFRREERENIRNAFAEIMLPLIRRFVPGLQSLSLRGQFGVLTVDPSEVDIHTILRQLWAVPIFTNIHHWLMLPGTDNIDGAVGRLVIDDIKALSKLMHGTHYLGVLLDATSKRETWELSEPDLELEHIFWNFKRSWRSDQPAGES